MQDRPHKKHAEKIIEQFRSEIGDDLCKKIGDYPFGSLSVLIESALNTAVMESMNDTVSDLENVLKRVKKRARA
ncbi:hypothetical protein [Thalassolituus marinus]|uniref:Phosphatase n=1 Tax=Thalassolituus marinus TaxID=671053 RepID=A0ABS7ZM26_9GAMM|nr:hypothetical protein [Thalassolituus marinus]MCA6062764.1 hypothetical protein [Thalassolituus marinus]